MFTTPERSPGNDSARRGAEAADSAAAARKRRGTLRGRGHGCRHPRDESGEASFVLTARATRSGEYLYLPFEVPETVRRIDIVLSKNPEEGASVGLGLFDHRGPHYQSEGFRGVYGAERKSCYVTATDAAQSFLPGPMESGTWTVLVPVFRVLAPTTIEVTVSLTFGRTGRSREPRRRDAPPLSTRAGWYAGDLHCHTPAASDAWASGSALTPSGWAETAAEFGLDFVSLTDHNVITQNRKRRRAMRERDGDVLLIGGEEMTNWFHGHATVTGLETGDWVDFRQRPAGVPRREHEARIERFVAAVREFRAYASVAHPMLAVNDNRWDFFPDAFVDPAARLHGIEVWNGPWTPEDEAALRFWDRLLQRGWRVTANGGSDTHGTDDPTFGALPGVPTTRVYASALSTAAIVEGLRRGRATVIHAPDGPELYLTGRVDDQRAMIGDAVTAPRTATVTFEATVRGGEGYTLLFVRDGEPVETAQIDQAEATVATEQPVADGGYVRLELRGEPDVRPAGPRSSRGGMQALTNPVFLEAADEGTDQ